MSTAVFRIDGKYVSIIVRGSVDESNHGKVTEMVQILDFLSEKQGTSATVGTLAETLYLCTKAMAILSKQPRGTKVGVIYTSGTTFDDNPKIDAEVAIVKTGRSL